MNTRPRLSEIPDSVVPPGVVGLARRSLHQQVLDAHEAAQVRRVDDDAALQLAHPQFRVRPDQPRRVAEVDRVHGRLQRRIPHHRAFDVVGFDLDLVVVSAQRLGSEREIEDDGRGIPVEMGRRSDRAGQAVFGEDRRADIDADRCHDDRDGGRGHSGQYLSHVDIVSQPTPPHGRDARGPSSVAPEPQVARYRDIVEKTSVVTAMCRP